MKSRPYRIGLLPLILLAGCAEPTDSRTGTGAVGGGQLTAVYSRASNDYVRVQNPDGSYPTETYVLKEGGNLGGPRVDATIDTLGFEGVSKAIAPSLASQNYVPAGDAAEPKLLIVVHWGVTSSPNDVNPRSSRSSARLNDLAQRAEEAANETTQPGERAAERARQQSYSEQAQSMAHMEASRDAQVDAKNANILGYTDEIDRVSSSNPNLGTLEDEIEQDRYYVVLLAYDYAFAAQNQGDHKLLWETRFSIPEQGNDFEKALPRMASVAATYLGQTTHGLIHHNLAEGHVNVGETKSLGTVPEK
jgi:hypothetical protein